MQPDQKLKSLRNQIDDIDGKLLSLLSERARCAVEVGKTKHEAGQSDFYRPEREAEVLRRVKEKNEGVLSDDEMARLFREIMSACLALEHPLKIAFLGPEGTYTQAAALKHFGHSVSTVPVAAIDEIFREVESGAAHYGVVPIENSTEGVVSHTLDMFMRSSLKICGEVELRIHHCLLSNEVDPKNITKVFSHQQSIAQCREWLNSHMAGVERITVSSNAKAAQLASAESGAAAIASETAGELYKLNTLVRNIEDEPENTTRFLVIGKLSPQSGGRDKTSLMLSAKNRPGALFSLLEPFAKHGVSMTRIESRPSRKGMWDYVFFVDVEGHVNDESVKKALDDISDHASMIKILGSYPRVVL